MSLTAHLREQIRDLLPLRAKLVLVSEQCEKRILELKVQERDEIRNLKQECQRLQDVVKSMRRQQSALQIQVELECFYSLLFLAFCRNQHWIIQTSFARSEYLYSAWLTTYRLITSMNFQLATREESLFYLY